MFGEVLPSYVELSFSTKKTAPKRQNSVKIVFGTDLIDFQWMGERFSVGTQYMFDRSSIDVR